MSVDRTSMDEAWNVLVKAKSSQVLPSRNIPTGGGSKPKWPRNVRRTERFDDGSRGRIPIVNLGQDSAGLARSKFGGAARLEEKDLLLRPEMEGLNEPEPEEEEEGKSIFPHEDNFYSPEEKRGPFKRNLAGMDSTIGDLTKSAQQIIQESFKDLMEKGAPVPNWAQQNNSNRSNFKGTEDYQQQTGGDAYASTYGGKPVGIQRMPSGNPKDMLNVKDLATGTYGGQEYGGQEPGYYAGNPNLTNKKINAFTAAEEAKKKPQPQPQPQPTIAPPVGQAFNTYQQQPQQVQTGEPMDLAFRLLKYTRPGRRSRNSAALEAHNQQIDRERKNLGLPRLTEAQRQKMVDENLLGSEVVRVNRAPKIETDGRVPVNVRNAMQEMRRKEMHEKKQDRLEATARRENKVHTRVPYEARTSDRGSGVNLPNAASPDEYNIKPSFDPDTAKYKIPTTDEINYRGEMKPTNPKSTGKEAGIAMEVHDEARLAEENNAKNWQKLDAETTRGLSNYLEGISPAGKDRVTRETQEERNRQTKLNDMALEFAENRGPKGLQNTFNANVELGRRGGYEPNLDYFNSTTDLSNIEAKEGREQGEATARRIEAAQQAAQAKQIADEIQRRNAASQNNIQENNTGNGEL